MAKRIWCSVFLIVALCMFVSCDNEADEFQTLYNEMEGVWYESSSKVVFSFDNQGEGYVIDSNGYTPYSITFYRNNDTIYIKYTFTSDGIKTSFEMPVEEIGESENKPEKLSDKPALVSGISKIHDPNIVGSWGEADIYNSDGTGKSNLYISGIYVLLDINWSTDNGVLTRVFYKDGLAYKTIKSTYVIYENDGYRWLKLF